MAIARGDRHRQQIGAPITHILQYCHFGVGACSTHITQTEGKASA